MFATFQIHFGIKNSTCVQHKSESMLIKSPN